MVCDRLHRTLVQNRQWRVGTAAKRTALLATTLTTPPVTTNPRLRSLDCCPHRNMGDGVNSERRIASQCLIRG